MSLNHSPAVVRDGLIMYYDTGNTKKSFKGKPTTNLVVTAPLTITTYAYCSGPVATVVEDATGALRTVNRYTITVGGGGLAQRARVVITPTTTGVNYAFTCKIKYNGGAAGVSWYGPDASKGNPEPTNNTYTTNTTSYTAIGNGWYLAKEEFSFATNPTGGGWLCYGPVNAALGETFDVYEEQFEVQQYATPYENGTRSATQSILDITAKHTLNVGSLAWSSSNSPVFNGTSSYLYSTGALNGFLTNGITITAMFKLNANPSGFSQIFGDSGIAGAIYVRSNGNIFGQLSITGTGNVLSGDFTPTLGTWYEATVAWSFGGTVKLYVNGTLRTQSAAASNTLSAFGGTSAGFYSGTYLNYDLGLAQIYNRELTAAEISQNFFARRGRFGL